MSYLSILPVEILECITGMVIASQHMRLWQCGDRILNVKLKNGGVKRTSLCWSHASWIPWPRWYFSTFYGIEDVEWGVSIGSSLCPSLKFELLPNTLKCLHLACDDVFVLLRLQKVNMNDLLPLLQSLHLSGSCIQAKNLQNLPSNLIELHVTSTDEAVIVADIFGDLPRSLQKLTLWFLIADHSELENDLPPALICLHIRSLSCHFNWFSKLPKSLKMLSIASTSFMIDFSELPRQLEDFKISSHLGEIPQFSLLLLPQALKTLELSFSRDPNDHDSIITILPKTLTRLKLEKSKLHHSELEQLPASLTDLEVEVAATCDDVSSLYPPESRRICIGDGFHSFSWRMSFPTKLQALKLRYIHDSICAMLPSGLQTLHFSGGYITTKGVSKFPKSLTSLNACFQVFDSNETMSYLYYIAKIEFWAQLATQAKSLNQKWLSALLPSFSSSTSPLHDHLAEGSSKCDFNEHISSLVLCGVRSWEEPIARIFIQNHFFASLPKFQSLKTLEIWYSFGISGDWFCLVPQNVTNLKLHSLITFPTATQLSTLPRCLRYLDLDVIGNVDLKCDWNDESLQSLPRSLQTFLINGSFPNLTQSMYEYLPPNLQQSSLNYEVEGLRSEFRKPVNRLYEENIFAN